MEQVERTPKTIIHVNLTTSTVEAEGFSCAVTLPSKTRDALVSGAWDTTGLLLDIGTRSERRGRRACRISGV